MKIMLTTLSILGLSAVVAMSQDTPGIDNGTSLGDVTKDALENDFDQGQHASDPSGDGRGPESRAGLANVVDDHDLSSTIDVIDGD